MKSTHRKAFATLYALILLGLLASAIVLITATLTADTRRTSDQLVDAQLRAILRSAADTRSPTLPPELTDAGFSLTLTLDPANASTLHITAKHARRSLTQTVASTAATLSRP